MAWRSHGTSNASLIDNLMRHGVIKSSRIAQAMKMVDRGSFVPETTYASEAYLDSPLPIGFNATISAPHMHAHVLEVMEDKLKQGARVLDVGSGSGYLVGVIAHLLMDPTCSPSGGSTLQGSVHGIEHIPELVSFSKQNLKKSLFTDSLLSQGRITVEVGDGQKGLPKYAPYDCIHVGAAAPHIPEDLIMQLAPNGIMVIPVGKYAQELMEVKKDQDGHVHKRALTAVMYVPLTSKEAQEQGLRF